MIDCCERLALILVAGNVIALGDTDMGKRWLKHHMRAHIAAPDASAEACSICRETAAAMLPDIEQDIKAGRPAAVHVRELAAHLSELLTQ